MFITIIIFLQGRFCRFIQGGWMTFVRACVRQNQAEQVYTQFNNVIHTHNCSRLDEQSRATKFYHRVIRAQRPVKSTTIIIIYSFEEVFPRKSVQSIHKYTRTDRRNSVRRSNPAHIISFFSKIYQCSPLPPPVDAHVFVCTIIPVK